MPFRSTMQPRRGRFRITSIEAEISEVDETPPSDASFLNEPEVSKERGKEEQEQVHDFNIIPEAEADASPAKKASRKSALSDTRTRRRRRSILTKWL